MEEEEKDEEKEGEEEGEKKEELFLGFDGQQLCPPGICFICPLSWGAQFGSSAFGEIRATARKQQHLWAVCSALACCLARKTVLPTGCPLALPSLGLW